jgi:hypothetical protein
MHLLILFLLYFRVGGKEKELRRMFQGTEPMDDKTTPNYNLQQKKRRNTEFECGNCRHCGNALHGVDDQERWCSTPCCRTITRRAKENGKSQKYRVGHAVGATAFVFGRFGGSTILPNNENAADNGSDAAVTQPEKRQQQRNSSNINNRRRKPSTPDT